ncbi:MAG TPA: DUF327 domain-containing protein [Clostridiales bacterium]|nr:DUF327 domain-containing protein [Clostridiales bacterium]
MKISSINNLAIDHLAKSGLSEAEGLKNTDLVFKSQLTNEKQSAYLKHVSDLVAQIQKQGKLLSERADMGELQKYREMITKLINETVSNGFVFEKEGRVGANGRSKIFAMIKKINDKLDEMTQKLLESEKENISLLDDIDDIRGLLVDMYL